MTDYTFKRYEYKYLLTKEQYSKILLVIFSKMEKDKYFKSTIQSLYYDTDSFTLTRNSLEKPMYKEKLRSRSYGLSNNQQIFLELKKKYDGIVYKRRIKILEKDILNVLYQNNENNNQISNEIYNFALNYSKLSPKILIIYDRIAFLGEDNLRITFDTNIRYRTTNLNLNYSLIGENVIDNNKVLMEIKCGVAMPIWLVKLLSEVKAYKTSFSKCGKAYEIEMNKITDNKEIKIYG